MNAERTGHDAESLLLGELARAKLWSSTVEVIEHYINNIRELPVSRFTSLNGVRSVLDRFDFAQPHAPDEVIRGVAEALSLTHVHSGHPRYFGLFNPTPTTMGIAADALVAAFNPQLATWEHSPFAVEAERRLIDSFGSVLGYKGETTSGILASGGSEANHTALLAALVHSFPEVEQHGLRALTAPPVLYVSSESHHSLHKGVRAVGLGQNAIREIAVDHDLRMRIDELETAIRKDRSNGLLPFLVVGTAGTTNAGAIDPLQKIAQIASHERLWFHTDGAWGGAVALVPELRHWLAGIEHSDSITIDAHKWLSVPMGASLFITRHPEILHRTFHISAAYVPPRPSQIEVADPYQTSLQWSRRFIGLKIFLSLAVAGWEGYRRMLRRMVEIGAQLRLELEASGWEIVNSAALPICCFCDATTPDGGSPAYLRAIAEEVVASGDAWVSTTRLGTGKYALRACITSYRTNTEDLHLLISSLNTARAKVHQVPRHPKSATQAG